MKTLLDHLSRLSKWWALIGLGAIVLLAGVLTKNFGMLAVGALLAVVGGAGEGFSQLDLSLPRGALKLKRETMYEATLRIVLSQNVSPEEAIRLAQAVAAEFPETGAPVTIDESGDASAALSDSSTILFTVPAGRALTEEEVARELAESQTAGLNDATTGRGYVLKQIMESLDPGDEKTVAKDSEINTSTFPQPMSAEFLCDFEGRLDPNGRFLIYPTGKFSLRVFEIEPGSRSYVGRAPENDLTLAGPQVSRVHALLDAGNPSTPVAISNLASTHGVYVNGESVESHSLRNQDVIGIGDFTLIYVEPERAQGGS